MIWAFLACGGNAAPAADALPVRFEPVGPAEAPTAIAVPPRGEEAPWVTEQAGRIVRLVAGKAEVVLDVRERVTAGGERGLLGLAFAPGWPDDPRVFVNYTAGGDDLATHIVSFRSADGGRTLDPASETTILTFAQPYPNHNGGALTFGPRGALYAAVGDGGSGGDPRRTGQDPGDLLGSILRLSVGVAGEAPPEAPTPGRRPEVWAYGVRNPWGLHVSDGTLWWADVGQNQWEEVDRSVAGGNYGWNVKEGTHCYGKAPCTGDFVEPVAEYGHDEGQAVVGGFVYHGPSIPAFDGLYVFADFSSGRFFGVAPEGGPLRRLGSTSLHPSTFGEGRDGTLYVADYGTGTVLVARAPTAR